MRKVHNLKKKDTRFGFYKLNFSIGKFVLFWGSYQVYGHYLENYLENIFLFLGNFELFLKH